MSARFRWTLTNLSDSTTEVLTKDPLGWEDMSIRLTRDKLYHGVFTEVSTSLKWHCEGGGKDFIDNVYQTEDINGIIEVLIEIDCDSSGTYTELYTGRLDLATYSTDGELTTATLERSDLYSKLRARDEISVDLESTTSIGEEAITAPGTAEVAMHSQLIFLKSRADSQEYSLNYTLETATSLTNKGFRSPAMTTQSSEAEVFFGVGEYNDFAINGPGAADTFIPEIFEATDDDVEYPDTYTYRIRIRGTFTDTVDSAISRDNFSHSLTLAWGTSLNVGLAAGNFVNLFSDNYTTGATTFTQAFDTGDLSGQITLNFGDKVWLYWFENEVITAGPYTGSLTHLYQYDEARFSIEIESLTSSSSAKTLLVHEAFNQVADSIADTNFSFYSEFYGRTNSDKLSYNQDGCGSLIAITNGLNIRQFEDKGIYCSLRDLFITFNALHNIGLGIEPYDSPYAPLQDIIRVETIDYFYDNATRILLLDRPVKVDVINDNSRYVNNINVGYDKWETEFSGGLDEPCSKHEYSTKINAVKGQYNKLSKYMASGYAIESTRRKNLEESKDWRYDNDNFLVAVKNGIDVIFVPGNVIIIPATSIIFGGVNIGDSMSVNSPLNSYLFTVANVYTISLGFPFDLYVIVVDAPDVVVLEAAQICTVGNSTQGWTQDGYVNFIPNGGGGLIFYSQVNSIDAGDVLEVSNTSSNDGTKTVTLEDTIQPGSGIDKTLIVFSEAGVSETANDALIYSETANLDFYSTELYADSFSSGTGMTSLDTAYNLRLTPARMLLGHLNVITACLQVIQGLISFVKGEGNTQLALAKDDIGCQEDYSGEILSESQSFDWNDSDAANITPIWLPEIYKFSYPLTSAQLASVRANPHGYIEVTDDHDNVRKGFILDFDYTLKTGLTKFELLKMYE